MRRPVLLVVGTLAAVASTAGSCSRAPAPPAAEVRPSYVEVAPDVHGVSVRGAAGVDGTDVDGWKRLISALVRDTTATPLLAGEPGWLMGLSFTDRSRPVALADPELVDTGLPRMSAVRTRSVSVGPIVVLAGADGPLAVAEVRIEVEADDGLGARVDVYRRGSLEMVRTGDHSWRIDSWRLAVDRRVGLLTGLGSVWPFSLEAPR